jgi:regulation of enolase protein 1 (concanavalin A-like superfamily)
MMGVSGSITEALDSSLGRPGQLYLQSTDADWNPAFSGHGPFLYKSLSDDFVVTVRITDFAGSADIALPYNRAGLMVRVGTESLAGIGEDWLSLDYYAYWGEGNCLRQSDNGQITNLGANNKSLAPDSFLQIERQGERFYCRTSRDGQQWQELPGSPLLRPDLEDLGLQVGVYQATASNTSGYAAFDDFCIHHPDTQLAALPAKASQPNPAHNTDGVSQSILSWQPGRDTLQQHVYLGSAAHDLTRVADSLERTRSWLVFDAGFSSGATYFWRVDSVNASGQAHPGDLWTFSTAPYEAYSPSPAPGEGNLVDKNLVMSWNAGKTAIWHDVYFSESRQLIDASHAYAFQGRQVNVSFDPGQLKAQTTYYWRVDEIELDPRTRHVGKVWSFTTMSQVTIENPDLVGWWTFNNASSGSVIDSSGYRNHGQVLGAPQPCPGYQGLGLAFDGVRDALRCTHSNIPAGSSAFTIAAWILPTVHNHTITWWGLPRPNQANELRLLGGRYCRHGFWNNNVDFDTGDLSGEWNHLTLTSDGHQRYCYVNGSPVTGHHTGQLQGPAQVAFTDLCIGANAQMSANFFKGSLDDLRIYRTKLNTAQIMALLQADTHAALAPQPEHRSQVPLLTRLAWTPGKSTLKHNLYLGTNQLAVSQAQTSDISGIFKGSLPHPYFSLPGALNAEQEYYWRVDEVAQDGKVTRGRIWSFVLMASQLLDDFEQYADYTPHRIFEIWLDGLGFNDPGPGYAGNGSGSVVGYDSAPFAETTIVHSGKQSLALRFDNSRAPYYSQTDLLFTQAQDWAGAGFTGLSLAFHGHAANVPAPEDCLYISLEDSTGRSVLVRYEGGSAKYAEPAWHEWTLSFDGRAELDWSQITALHIGIGNPENPTRGSSGRVFIDDIYVTQSM